MCFYIQKLKKFLIYFWCIIFLPAKRIGAIISPVISLDLGLIDPINLQLNPDIRCQVDSHTEAEEVDSCARGSERVGGEVEARVDVDEGLVEINATWCMNLKKRRKIFEK